MPKSQSAMEYLMTYGWAILIIAVVLGALFQLGVFSGVGAPKAPPGACQVQRLGSGISQQISLVGECQGQEPQYVAQFNGAGQITATVLELPQGANPRTITAWYYSLVPSSTQSDVFAYGSLTCSANVPPQYFEVYTNLCGEEPGMNAWCTDTCLGSSPTYSNGTWAFVAYEFDGANQIGYLGYYGNLQKTQNIPYNSFNTQGTTLYIGHGEDRSYFVGFIANVQAYNISLSPNEMQALYAEGIGGAPIRPQNLIGWWPLNGDAKDYSGNNNDGAVTGISYTSSWTSGYTTP